MNRSVSPPPLSKLVEGLLSEPFEDESGVHELPTVAPRSREAETEPPPPSSSQREVWPPSSGDRPTPLCPAPAGRTDAVTMPAPASEAAHLRSLAGRATQPADVTGGAGAAARSHKGIDALLLRMRDTFAEGQYAASLEAAQQVIALQPANADALSYARTCERLLEKRHVERIGELGSIPVLAIDPDQVRWLALDHREGFVLSLVDGVTTIEELIDISGLGRVDVLRTIAGLLEAEVIRLR